MRLVTYEALEMVGLEHPLRSEALDPGTCLRWARAVHLPERTWRVGDLAPGTVFMPLAKPPMGPETAAGRPTPDEEPLYWLPPLTSPRTVNGGDEITVDRPLRVGDEVVRRCRLADVVERTTSTGRLRAIVTSETTYEVDGEIAVTWRNHTVTLPLDEDLAPAAPAARARVRDGEVVLVRRAGPVEVARFAAMNEELALQHVDPVFAAERLGTAGAVVMGWLRLALIVTAAELRVGLGRLRRVSARYHGIDPVGSELTVRAGPGGRVTVDSGGPPTTTGTIALRDANPDGWWWT